MAQPADSFARDSRANVQKSTVVLSHTVSMAFLEMQGQNARKFQVPQLANDTDTSNEFALTGVTVEITGGTSSGGTAGTTTTSRRDGGGGGCSFDGEQGQGSPAWMLVVVALGLGLARVRRRLF